MGVGEVAVNTADSAFSSEAGNTLMTWNYSRFACSQRRLSCVQGIQDAGGDSRCQRRSGAALLVELAQDAERLWCTV